MTSWLGSFATWKIATSLWLPMSIGTFAVWVIGPIALGRPSARLTSRNVFACVVLMLYLQQNPSSIKSSVARESIIALIVICLVVPCSRIVTIICSFSLFNASVLFSTA